MNTQNVEEYKIEKVQRKNKTSWVIFILYTRNQYKELCDKLSKYLRKYEIFLDDKIREYDSVISHGYINNLIAIFTIANYYKNQLRDAIKYKNIFVIEV